MVAETKVEIVSRKMVKPSTATAQQNRVLKLSVLDQVIPPVYIPLVMFYSSKTTKKGDSRFEISEISKKLKQSLSETLVNFYPFAGRQKDGSSIDCNDEGACFAEAHVHCNLSDFLQKPDFKLLLDFLLIPFTGDPSELVSGVENPILHVQVTSFSCGGMAIAISISHKFVDGASVCAFVHNWSAITRGQPDVVPPIFVGGSLLPAVNDLPSTLIWKFQDKKWTTRRFVFHLSKLASFKATIDAVSAVPSTKVELVTAILFKRFLAASQSASGSFQPAVLYQFVNLRRRMNPPLPQNTIGNVIWNFPVLVEESNAQLDGILIKIRKGFEEFCSEKADKFKGDSGFPLLCELFKDNTELAGRDVSVCMSTSLCNFPSYQITDFGWGEPAWITCPMHSMPSFVFTDTRSRDGIEVWVTLDEQVMAKLESDEELLQFASLNPSVVAA